MNGPAFAAALAAGPDWGQAAKACLDRLSVPAGANLGFLYVTDHLAEDIGSILTLLKAVTGVRDWVGAVGIGICGTAGDGAAELFDEPGIAVLVARLPDDSWRVFPAVTGGLDGFREDVARWRRSRPPLPGPRVGIVHADPRHRGLDALLPRLAGEAGGFLMGGLVSSRGTIAHVGGAVQQEGVSGVLLDGAVSVATGVAQGCAPIGPEHVVTEAAENVIHAIDGRRAFSVFREEIGELLARDMRRIDGYIYAALPVPGRGADDYLVRNIVRADPIAGWVAVGEAVAPGQPVRFCRRDPAFALAELERMAAETTARLPVKPRGALYVSCVARGPSLFGGTARGELETIARALPGVPLAGFFASGEISHSRLYGYSGVLTLLG
ncbi:MAG TPA: FIST N-terminal domain-containing protein [Azospirillaceae bacterium]|nr:FIST N-terminal domain-containing protein [Azospirillaceae bacterium]